MAKHCILEALLFMSIIMHILFLKLLRGELGKDHRVLLHFDSVTPHFKNKETGLENLGKTS